ncbi:MAG: metallophosphoesterase [Candidatus Desulforudis sp.]|nr:metallophosphoesterase [Desulforudis sp.]
MRLLYLTDTHIRAGNPPNRLDDFPAALRAKLLEVTGLVRELEVHAVLHGGDFFDQPCPELPVVGEFVKLFTGMGVPVYVVPGNHDIFACNPATLEHTMLGLLHEVGSLRVLQTGERIYLKERGVTVQLTGTPFHYNIDRQDPLLDYCVTKENCDFAIHLAHGMLLDRPFFPGTPYTLVSQVAPFTEADYTLGSHAHFGYPDVEWEGRLFINPGSVVRLSAQKRDLERRPQVLLIDFSGARPSRLKIPLKSARPGHEVIGSGAPPTVRGGQRRKPLVPGDGGGEVGGPDLPGFLAEVARGEGFPEAAAAEAVSLLARVPKDREEEAHRAELQRLVIENFQSHLYTELELAPGLNVILGESSQGKSGVIRALHWLLFNEPPPQSFMRTDGRFTRVTGVLEDRSLVVREYTRPGGETGPGRAGGECGAPGLHALPSGRTLERFQLPLIALAEDREVCLHIAPERGEAFLLADPDAVKAQALDYLSGAALLEKARREAGRAGPTTRGNAAEEARASRERVGALFGVAAARARDETCSRVADMVNQALRTVFEAPPEFKIRWYAEGAAPRAEFTVVTEFGGGDLSEAAPTAWGGGVIDVISLALRVAFLELVRPPLSGPLVLDEPVKQVSSRFASHVARLLKVFADSFGRQIIVATHNQHLAGTADAVFVLRLESGVSVLYGRGSSIRASSWRGRAPG